MRFKSKHLLCCHQYLIFQNLFRFHPTLLSKFPLLSYEEFPSTQLMFSCPINISNTDEVSDSLFFPNTFLILIFSIAFFQLVSQ